MKETYIENLFTLDETIAKDLFLDFIYPWEVLPKINAYICKLGETLSPSLFDKKGDNIWIAKSAKIFESVHIDGPCIIDENAEIRHCAFVRGNVIVGKNAVVGNSTELKNVILFNKVQVPHYNYVGDSILGYQSHMGAGAITSNVKSDKQLVVVHTKTKEIKSNLKKFGAMLGDHVEVGCNSVLNPGTVIGKNTNIYPVSIVRGVISSNSIYKSIDNIVTKTENLSL